MNIQEIKETIQSSHINFLIGAGLSTPFLPLLGDIESRLSKESNKTRRILIEKEYLQNVILPNIDVISKQIVVSKQDDYNVTINSYKKFFDLIAQMLLARKNTILSKQANIFTTNIDILLETAIEENGLEYNDGFSGRLNSIFSLSNFKKSLLKRSLHFENISEIPVFNIIKMHGSLTWEKIGDRIYFTKIKHIDKSLLNKTGKRFEDIYRKLAIVNPEKKKLEETVIDLTYYELLRMFSIELEKENVVLFVMGFSMNDEHIREITIRTANSNPTLKVYILCFSKDESSEMKGKMCLGKLRYSNIEILEPDDNEIKNHLTLSKINESIFDKNINHTNE